MARDLAVAMAVARKDALSELRGRHATGSTLFFAAIVLLLFGFALGPDANRLEEAAPGLLWLAIVFAGLLAVGRLHEMEAEDGALEQLALYPVSRHALYLGKALAGFAAMLVLGVALLPIVALLYRVDLLAAWLPLGLTARPRRCRLRRRGHRVRRTHRAHGGARRPAAAPRAAGRGAAAPRRREGDRGGARRRSLRRAGRVAPAPRRLRRR